MSGFDHDGNPLKKRGMLIHSEMGEDEEPGGLPVIEQERYVDLGLIGAGGGGEVRRVFDPILNRTVAMKVLHPAGHQQEEATERFHAEARLCARLSHPAIIAVHDWGVLSDGRPYIVMPIVSGKDFSRVIQDAYRFGAPKINVLKRLVSIVRTTCEAIAYAHTRKVLHRDLKPGNIMVGDFGEVIVLDWGLASLRSSPVSRLAAARESPDPISLSISVTRPGEIKGSLGYMAPEQARGDVEGIDRRTDVFTLGAVLFEVLTAGPLWGADPMAALRAARDGVRVRVPRRRGLPEAIAAICEVAIHPEPDLRYQSAADMARAVGDWIDGLDDLIRARALVRSSDEALRSAWEKQQEAFLHDARAEKLLVGVSPIAPEEEKLASWAEQKAAVGLRHEADMLQFQRIQLLDTALSYAPAFSEAHERLASHYYDLHQSASDPMTAGQLELLLRKHDRGQYTEYLKGVGHISFATSRPVQVQLLAYGPHRRRLRAQPVGVPTPSPVVSHELPIGSYLAELRAEDGVVVRYPLPVTRNGHTTTAPGPGEAPEPIWIPRAEDLPEGMVYVPAGTYWCGGDDRAFGLPLPLSRVWVDGFFISRHPVTNAEYIAFLDDLIDRGFAEAALACCPRERGGSVGSMVYGRTDSGHFELIPDHDGDLWDPRWPVVMVPFAAMQAYAAWRTEQTERLHRLPYELEWEKAARGSGDQREHVWGTDAFDPTWCQVAVSTGSTRSSPAPVGARPIDVSPYGVYGMAGNATDICLDHYHRDGPVILNGRWSPREEPTGLRTVRGGQWAGHPGKARLCWRGGAEESARSALNGFRLVVPAS
ncbi:MAG: serine/threonine protein kinase/formylglycine-generating enzyme required for sulfatase activity [Myxococcota bacterium]|jgi:serine/threonine protein kinase/formylglycine-generating enzyme required for sulfatase activity